MSFTMRQVSSRNLPVTCPQLGTSIISIISDVPVFLGYDGLLSVILSPLKGP